MIYGTELAEKEREQVFCFFLGGRGPSMHLLFFLRGCLPGGQFVLIGICIDVSSLAGLGWTATRLCLGYARQSRNWGTALGMT